MERILKNWGLVIVIPVTSVIRPSRQNRVMRYIIQTDVVQFCIFGLFSCFIRKGRIMVSHVLFCMVSHILFCVVSHALFCVVSHILFCVVSPIVLCGVTRILCGVTCIVLYGVTRIVLCGVTYCSVWCHTCCSVWCHTYCSVWCHMYCSVWCHTSDDCVLNLYRTRPRLRGVHLNCLPYEGPHPGALWPFKCSVHSYRGLEL
jgi:hypothetical protein